MVIQSSNVNLVSSRDYSRSIKGSRKVTEWQDSNPANCRVTTTNYSYTYDEQSLYNNYNDLGKLQNSNSNSNSQTMNPFNGIGISQSEASQPDSLAAYIESTRKVFYSLLELLFRAKKKLDYSDMNKAGSTTLNLMSGNAGSDVISLNGSNVWNRVTEEKYTLKESEFTEFGSTGTAVTADGRKISFNVSFSLGREFCREYNMESMEQYERVVTDPLVINLDSNPVSLSDKTFLFDINNDGVKEEISALSESSGFLAFDRNGDGIINDGSELFGTASGDGFADLAAYDSDGNGWIDEADEIFSKLKVWIKTEDGKDMLLSLKEADVGAIYLGRTKSSFSLNDKDNNVNGIIRNTGIFLHESGDAGTIQQIDLANHSGV